MATGTVKWFNTTSRYGFISPDEGHIDIWLRQGTSHGDVDAALCEGDRVEFDLRDGGMGAEAINVLVLDRQDGD
jgi:cold shock CspA family protein